MLNVKNLTLLSQKNWKKVGILTTVAFATFICNFLPTTFEKVIFSSKWLPKEELKCKNAQFLQWILKDDDVYFKKKSQHRKFEGILS